MALGCGPSSALSIFSLTVPAEIALSPCLIARFTRFERSAKRDRALGRAGGIAEVADHAIRQCVIRARAIAGAASRTTGHNMVGEPWNERNSQNERNPQNGRNPR
jgi:hypothetical protein